MVPEFGVPLKDLQASILADFELKPARSRPKKLKNAVEIVQKFVFSRQAFFFHIETLLNGKPLNNGCLFVPVETKLAK